jgi:hypothetical protein
MVAAKPDCTGQEFGWLTVVGRGERVYQGTKWRRLWILECRCGKVIQKARGDFDAGKQVSCGCKRRTPGFNKRECKNLKGKRFGMLAVIKLLPQRRNKKADWLCLCDCGGMVNKTSHQIGAGYRLNCGKSEHMPGAVYPIAPSQLPGMVWETVKQWQRLTEHPDPVVRDKKMERLMRCAWILHYREYVLEENITELYRSNYIKKSLRFITVDVFWDRKIEEHGGQIIDRHNRVRKKVSGYDYDNKIGKQMAHLTLPEYPIAPAQTLDSSLLLSKKRCYGVKTC